MDYRLLGRTGLRVSPLCLGTMNFGPQTDEAASHQIMDAALEVGINFFDTANVYGDGARPSRSSAAGSRRAAAGARRSCSRPRSTARRDPWPNTSQLSALHIRQACEASLRRLQTDHIDLYQMHHVDRDTPWDEIWQAMDLLVAAGQGALRRQLATSPAGTSSQANEAARRRGSLGLVSEQSLYNLNARTVELEVLPGVRGATASASSRGARSAAACSAACSRKIDRGPARRRAACQAAVERNRDAARGVGGAVRRAGRAAGRRGAGVAAAPTRR